MTEFDKIYEASRHNGWSGYYWISIFVGMGVLMALTWIRNSSWRISGKVVSIVAFTWLAYHFAVLENEEKWRIRLEWAELRPERLTEEERLAMADRRAVNGPFGPVLSASGAGVTLVTTTVVIFMIRNSRSNQNHVRALDSKPN